MRTQTVLPLWDTATVCPPGGGSTRFGVSQWWTVSFYRVRVKTARTAGGGKTKQHTKEPWEKGGGEKSTFAQTL